MRDNNIRMKWLAIAAIAAALSPAAAFADRDWTGPYVGGNIGMGTSNGTIEDKDCFDCVQDNFTERLFQFGAHAGYNKEINGLVLGGEGELTYGTQHHTAIIAQDDGAGSIMSDDSTLNWTLSALGRMGVVVGDAMFYVGAGPAMSHISGTARSFDGTFQYQQAHWQPGLKAALGLEFFVCPKASVRLQYSMLMVSDRSANITGTFAGMTGSERLDWLNSQQVGTIGFDWHF